MANSDCIAHVQAKNLISGVSLGLGEGFVWIFFLDVLNVFYISFASPTRVFLLYIYSVYSVTPFDIKKLLLI